MSFSASNEPSADCEDALIPRIARASMSLARFISASRSFAGVAAAKYFSR